MTRSSRLSTALAIAAAFAASSAGAQCVSLTTLGSAYTQNFDTLSNTAGSTTNNLTITGWFLTETGGGARDNEQYAVDTGGSNTGDTYSYGSAGSAERALGGLQSGTLIPVFGACVTNNTGGMLTSLDLAYTGEQWRIGNTAAARDDRIDFQISTNATSLTTGTWTDVNALDFTNLVKTAAAAGALDGNAAANRTAVSSTIPALAIANGATFWIRWTDLNASGADDGLAVDEFSLTPQGGVVTPTLNVNDVTLSEGDPPGTTTFTFAVTLTAPAGAGGVTFDIATADGTAQDDNPATEDNDYVAQSLTGQSIPMGSSGPYNFNVTVNRDTTVEPNETFFVNVTNITGANAGDTQGQGTINNDDVTLTPIHDIQGPGGSSPLVGASVTTRGLVTGVKSNGFFIQEPDATVDADPATSEGIFVFTGGAPPAAATVGNQVQVTATIAEFVPTQDLLQPPLTELTSPTVVQLSTGNPLPVPVPLTALFPDPAGAFDQLERLEGMRVSLGAMTVSGPTLGNINEANATASSSGVFFGVVTGVPRPFREAGIQAPDPAPAGTIPPIPRWDQNPELLRVDSDGLVGGPLIDVGVGAVVTGLVGPLDYSFRRYTILPDPVALIGVSGGPTAVPAAAATPQEFTVASYNLERFFDTVNDPGIGEPVLTATAFDNRLNKASLAVRDFLRAPDILGVIEVENLATLQALAARISADAVAAAQPDPQYDAYLVEGNDVGGIDVGFLVKTAVVAGATPRVTVNAVVQENAGELFVNPDTSTDPLNDRPSLRLDAAVNHANGAVFPLTVIVNHLRSLNDVDSVDPGSNGWATDGDRVRAKRQKQAESLANLVQARQTADAAEHIVLVGDFNAFEFNDGLVDSMGVIDGTPSPDNETAVPGDGVDLANPDLANLGPTAPVGERYSFVFDGNAQSLDHVLVNDPLVTDTLARRIEHPRIGADFPETARNDATNAVRLSDHDPVVAYFQVGAFATADLSITKTDTPDPVTAGTDLTYTVTVTNDGPDAADAVGWSDTLPAGTTFVSLAQPGGWTCSTPAVGAGGTVSCSLASLAVDSAIFTLTVRVDPSVAAGTVLSNTAEAVTSTANDPTDDSATETTTVATSAAVSVIKLDDPDPVSAGGMLTYTITVTNEGPSAASLVTLGDPLPAGTTFLSMAAPAGWGCTLPAVGTNGVVSCSIASLPIGSAVFTLTVLVDPGAADGSLLVNTASATSSTPNPDPSTATFTTSTTVSAANALFTIAKADLPDPVIAGQNLTYTLTATNSGSASAESAQLTDALPAGTTFVSLGAPGGWTCTTPAVGAAGTIDCSIAPWAPGSAAFTLVVEVGDPGGPTLTNVAQLEVTDSGRSASFLASAVTAVVGPASLSATKAVSGSFRPGGTVTYTVVITNAGPGGQADLAGDEFTDVLPAPLTLVSASATAGTATATIATNTVTWNGALAANASVTITIQATLSALAAPGSTVSNQGTVSFDADGNGTNEASAPTDDPATGASGDATSFAVARQSVVEIPALDGVGLTALAALLAAAALTALRRVRQ